MFRFNGNDEAEIIMIDEIKFTCEECGKVFDPDPDTMLETHWEAEHVPPWEADKMEEAGQIVTPEMLEEASADELAKAGITPEMKEKLLNGEEIVAGAMCICWECQDRLAEEQS